MEAILCDFNFGGELELELERERGYIGQKQINKLILITREGWGFIRISFWDLDFTALGFSFHTLNLFFYL